MKRITISFVFLLITFTLNAQDFRKFNWGDGIEKVKTNENAIFITEMADATDSVLGKLLMYQVTINGDVFILGYWFHENKLYIGKYIMLSDQTQRKFDTADDYVLYKLDKYKEFEKLVIKYRSLLKEKYGNPKEDQNPEKSIDELSQEDKQMLNQSLFDKGSEKYTVWDNKSTRLNICLKIYTLKELMSDNTLVDCFSITYRDIKSKYLNDRLLNKDKDNQL